MAKGGNFMKLSQDQIKILEVAGVDPELVAEMTEKEADPILEKATEAYLAKEAAQRLYKERRAKLGTPKDASKKWPRKIS